jgi:hypothetical protein
MIARMRQPGVHDSVRRNVVRIMQTIEIPPHLLGTVATVCFDYLSSQEQPIAVRCFSMTVLARIALKKPDLARELRLVIETQLPYVTAGFRARARKTLDMLDGHAEAR